MRMPSTLALPVVHKNPIHFIVPRGANQPANTTNLLTHSTGSAIVDCNRKAKSQVKQKQSLRKKSPRNHKQRRILVNLPAPPAAPPISTPTLADTTRCNHKLSAQKYP